MKTSRGFDIRRQVLAAFALIAGLLLATALVGVWALTFLQAEYTSYIEGFVAQEERLLTYQNEVSVLQSNAREFLITRRAELQRGAEAIFASMEANLEGYVEEAEHLAEGTEHQGEEHHRRLEELVTANDAYWDSYRDIVELWREKGLSEESGLRGALRQAADDLEAIIEANGSSPLMVNYLTIRRHEKDYLLRGDQRYIERNRESVGEIRDRISASGVGASSRAEMNEALDIYQEALAGLVDIDSEIASATNRLTRRSSALTGAVRAEIADAEEQLSSAREATESRIRSAVALTIGIALLGLLVAVVTALVTRRRISRPMLLLLKGTEKIAEGDLTSSIEYEGRDEFGQISFSLNNAISQIRSLVGDAHSSADAIRDISNSLAESTTESASAITQITANVRSISDQNDTLAAKTAGSAQASERIAGETRELRELVEGQSAMVTETTSSVEQMIANIRNVTSIAETKQQGAKSLVEMADTGGAEVQKTNQIASEIGELASGIEEVIKVINGISAQTNLLAMNAAIEAAHAGDAGRGFAVVAGEIRTLAESSGSNAKRIADMLKHLTYRIRAVDDSSSSSTQLFESIRREIGTYSDSLEEITAAMREMSIGSNEVLKAAEEMSASSNQISDRSEQIKSEIELIGEGTKEVDDLASQVSTGLTEIKGALTEIDSSVSRLSTLSENNRETFVALDLALDRFRVDESGGGKEAGGRHLEERASAGWTLEAPDLEIAETELDLPEEASPAGESTPGGSDRNQEGAGRETVSREAAGHGRRAYESATQGASTPAPEAQEPRAGGPARQEPKRPTGVTLDEEEPEE
jgi:methyl-accepting chemotaxis protein